MPTASATPPPTTPAAPVRRVEVRPLASAGDPRADNLAREARLLGVSPSGVRTARVYLIEGDLSDDDAGRVLESLLVNRVVERGEFAASPAPGGGSVIEVHPLPGVMDPAAGTIADAIESLLGTRPRVSTGWRYEFEGLSPKDAERLAQRLLANPVVHAIHTEAFCPDALPVGHATPFALARVELTPLDDAGLERLSRDGHLFLSLDEMRAARDHFRALGREPTDIELETLAQTWSEHCVHKTLKSTIRYASDDPEDPVMRDGRTGHARNDDGSVTITNLLKSTVAAATNELIADGVDWTLSVFVDNAGIIEFDDHHAVCVKVETHNHPSAIEPYGGAATGIGGCIRDIMGTGLAAKPIASTDVFCVAPPGMDDVPAGCLRPKRILTEVVAGVRDYGNRMGIPTLNGAVWFDERHVGNPLVFCGCVGLMPRRARGDDTVPLTSGEARPGDRIIALGGRTGRDGIHGATFSSAELTDTHADEFAHAVQIGNAIEEKRTLDAILRARDAEGGPLYSAITDCGAGGFSSAIGEMGEQIGAEVHLERAPLKYEGLTYTEIWISEAQERMVLAVPESNVAALQAICDEEHVELADLGTFGTPDAELVLRFHDNEVARISMDFLHNGIPTPTREAAWTTPESTRPPASSPPPSIRDALLQLLAHPNIASKHWIARQYDHEVQGNTILRPLVGPMGRGPSDAAVIEPVPGTGRGLAIGCGLATGLEDDPYRMALAAIDECVRNLVCVGADPSRIAILDNFCWPSCAKPANLASLVRAAEGCYDGAMAYRTPFVSGKDSLNNQFTTDAGETIEIPPTLLITGIGIVDDITKCVTSDAKRAGNTVFLIGDPPADLAGSHYQRVFDGSGDIPAQDASAGADASRFVADLIARGVVCAAHDVSDGGILVALSEMLIAGSTPAAPLGADADLDVYAGGFRPACFGEGPAMYLLEIDRDLFDPIQHAMDVGAPVRVHPLAELTDTGVLEIHDLPEKDWASGISVEDLTRAWRGTLDF